MALMPASARRGVIDWDHPLAQDLRLVVLPSRASGKFASAGYSAQTIVGPGIRQGVTTASGIDSAASGHTFIVVADLSAVTADAVAFGRLRYSGSANYGAGLRFNAAVLELDGGIGSSAWHYSAASSGVQTGRHCYAGAIGVGDVTSTGRLWRDGALLTTGIHSATAFASTRWDAQIDIGKGTASGATAITAAISGHIECGLYYTRSLASEDVEELMVALLRGRLPFERQRRTWVAVSAGGGTSINAQAGALSISSAAPTVSQSANQSAAPSAGTLTLSGFAPSIAQPQAVAPSNGSVTLQGFAPTVTQLAGANVAPDVGAVSLSGFAPTIAQPQAVAAGSGPVSITGYAPDVLQASGVLPAVGSITITGAAPTVAQTAAQTAAPATGSVSLTGYAPDIAQSGQPQPAGGGIIFGGLPRKKRYVVQNGRKVLVFGTEEAARLAQAAIDKARALRDTAPAATSNRARRRVEKTARNVVAGALAHLQPVDAFTVQTLQQLADTYAASDTLAELQRLRDLDAMARMWQDLRDEADDESALLELL